MLMDMEITMIDFHTHVLFGMDDGAQSIEDSIELIKLQREQGVKTIVVTPHYNCLHQDIEDFVDRRDKHLSILKHKLQELQINDMNLLSGAEILYSSDLHDMNLDSLVIEGTDYILIEFSTNSMTLNLENKLSDFINKGYIPILAHIERYPFFLDKPSLITHLIELGCYMQVNGSTFIEGRSKNFIKSCIKHNLIHFVASDCHNNSKRKPNVGEAYKVIEKDFGKNISDYLKVNNVAMISNKEPRINNPGTPKILFGKYI